MQVTKLMNGRRGATAAAAAMVALALCGQARAQVMDQVPSDAAMVLRIKSLDGLSTKVAGMAKTFGLDELQPEFKDPLGTMLERGHLTKGVNKSGDAALAVFVPDKDKKHAAAAGDKKDDAAAGAMSEEPEMVAIVPVSDYDAFVGNFEKAEGGTAEMSAVKDPEGAGKTMYIVHRGKYAVFSNQKEHLAAKGAGGFKVSGLAAKEAEAKDAIFLINVPAIRAKALPELKNNRKKTIEDMNAQLAGNDQLKQFQPVFNTVANEALDFAEQFLTDAQSIAFTMNITDAGLAGGGLVEFAPDSKYGKTVAEMKAHAPTGGGLLAGLPDRKYFVVGGMTSDPASVKRISSDILDPIERDLKKSDNKIGQQLADSIDTVKQMMGSMTQSAAGWAMPTKPLGQESVVQTISVAYGDAKTMAATQKKLLGNMNDLMSLMPQNQGVKTKMELGAEPKTIDGVNFQTYTNKFDMDENDPKAAQLQQFMAMFYGPNGMGGEFGAVDEKTFIAAQGASDELLKDAIASAKGGKDVLSQSAAIKSVASQLPKDRQAEYYVSIDNIVTSVVRYAQGFGVPVKMKLPQNLAPLAFSAGCEGPAIRFDGFVPAQTVQSLVAAGIQAYTQMQNGGAGGGL